jgi:hypothetical protein
MPRADRTNTTPVFRRVLLAGIAVVALSGPAFAWDYSTPTPSPTMPSTVNNGGSGGKGGHASSTASATAGSATATGGMATATSSPSQRVVVRVDPTVSSAPSAATAPTRSATAAGDPSGSRRSTGAGDPSGAGDPAGDGRHGGRGGGVAAPPGFALPSFDAGQCSTVGFGIAISPSGGGAFGPAWESTNCRAYYNALALYKMGYQEQAVALLRRVFPDVDAAFASTAPKVAPISAPPAAPAIDCNVVNAAQTGHGRMSPAELQAYRACHA